MNKFVHVSAGAQGTYPSEISKFKLNRSQNTILD